MLGCRWSQRTTPSATTQQLTFPPRSISALARFVPLRVLVRCAHRQLYAPSGVSPKNASTSSPPRRVPRPAAPCAVRGRADRVRNVGRSCGATVAGKLNRSIETAPSDERHRSPTGVDWHALHRGDGGPLVSLRWHDVTSRRSARRPLRRRNFRSRERRDRNGDGSMARDPDAP